MAERCWIDDEWDEWGPSKRLDYVREQLFNFGLSIFFGQNLRVLRSPLIESWLARPVSSVSV